MSWRIGLALMAACGTAPAPASPPLVVEVSPGPADTAAPPPERELAPPATAAASSEPAPLAPEIKPRPPAAWRQAIEFYMPAVKPGNQTALNQVAPVFA